MTLIDRDRTTGNGAVWRPRPGPTVDPAVVAEVHVAVGEHLTRVHAANEAAGRPRLTVADERALTRKLIGDELRRLAAEAYKAAQVPLDPETEAAVAEAVFDRLHGMDGIQPLLDDPEIRDIHISGCDRV